MDFGVVLQTDPPASAIVEVARRAEAAGFSHVWTFDSCVLWQEPFVIYPRILEATEHLFVGPMVTNPASRDWTVTSLQQDEVPRVRVAAARALAALARQ